MSLLTLSGPGLVLTFSHEDDRLTLVQMQRQGGEPILHADAALEQSGAGPVGNPLAVVVVDDGPRAGVWGAGTFRVRRIESDQSHLRAYLDHDELPMQLAIDVAVEGHVASWRAQACWQGPDDVEADIYFPLLSRVQFAADGQDRALLAVISGSVAGPLSQVNVRRTYLGNLSCPVFLIDGGDRGLAVLDDNRADYAPDPGACVGRSHAIGNTFPLAANTVWPPKEDAPPPGEHGPFVGVCHTRRFSALAAEGEATAADPPDNDKDTFLSRGDCADLGPIRTYAYEGAWQAGASWLRERRSHVSFRASPARWYQRTTFVGEHMGDQMVQAGQSFHDYADILATKRALGTDWFHVTGYHDPAVVGQGSNWGNRGDYFFAAQNLGGFDAARRGVETVHRRGGHIIYYVEGLIMWKRSRIGLSKGREWALRKADGTYDEHYKGFWHMCPACGEWCDWLAQTCAEVVRTVGVDGFFIDSSCITHNHRCYNPAHGHPHPDVWNWGVRQMLRRVRQAVDAVNPNTILLVEGCADMAREFADGFISHGHQWSGMTLDEPLVRFLHPDMRAYESWHSRGGTTPTKPMELLHVWNSVNGYRIYSHNPNADEMAALGTRTRHYYDAFPEICDAPMSAMDVDTDNCIARLFEAAPSVVTVGNTTPDPVEAAIHLPVACGMLFDRVDSTRVPVEDSRAKLPLAPWQFRAFELRV